MPTNITDNDDRAAFVDRFCVRQSVSGTDRTHSAAEPRWVCDFPSDIAPDDAVVFPSDVRRFQPTSIRSQPDAASSRRLDAVGTTAEPFPVVFAVVLLAASVLFTIFVVLYQLRSSSCRRLDNVAGSVRGSRTAFGAKPSQERNSWIESPDGGDEDGDHCHGTKSPRQLTQSVDAGESPGTVEANDTGGVLPPALMSWRYVSCSYNVKASQAIAKAKATSRPSALPQNEPSSTEVRTLHNAHGVLRSTELAAIMGPSGGGKSTLLDIISGRKSLGTITGELSVLGQRNDVLASNESAKPSDILQRISAYVPQQEQFFPTQTPQEAVAFFANLKLGRDPRGDHVRQARIDGLLDMVGLTQTVRRRPIGGTLAGGITIRGLSGGERKRLALACAVAMKPKILFLDEITSGLDSENAIVVISLLKKMCISLKVAAAVVIHQPSIDVFEQFDRMILLAKGKCIFSDRLSMLLSFYENVVHDAMPSDHLVPNDLLRRATLWDHSDTVRRGEPSAVLDTADRNDREARMTNTSPSGQLIAGQELTDTLTMSTDLTTPPVYWRFSTVFIRNLQNHYVRNLTNLAARLLIYGSTCLLLGMIFWGVADVDKDESISIDQARYVLGAGLFLSQTSFLLPFAQISTFFFDKNVFASESALKLYPSWMYAVSQFLLEAWVLILASLLEAAVAVPMMSLWNPAMDNLESFFTLLAFFAINGLTGNAIVLLISMVSFSQDFAFLAGSTVVAISLATSGGYVPFAVIPEWIRWLQWMSPVKYSLQAFAMALFDGTETPIVQILGLDEPSTITSNIGVLMGMFGCCALGTIGVLSLQKEVR